MPDETPTTEEVTLPTGGSLPGIPGTHGPGRYLIDWAARTIRRVEEAIEHLVEVVAPVEQTTAPTSADAKEK